MRKYICAVIILLASMISVNAQRNSGPVFTNVPVQNGRVVFQQFIHVDKNLTADEKYALLQKWGRDNFSGNSQVTGMRFDDKGQNLTVSAKTDLTLPAKSNGAREKTTMNYRFDVSVVNAGCRIIIRDITYLQGNGDSFFPKSTSAEEIISDPAISEASGANREQRMNTQKATLAFFNDLFYSLNDVYTK